MTKHRDGISGGSGDREENELRDLRLHDRIGISPSEASDKANGTMATDEVLSKEVVLPEMPTVDLKGLKPGPHDSPLYTESSGFDKETGETTWWEGRNMAGVAIGIIRFQANLPMIPGNMGNASTFKFPVVYVQAHYKNIADIMAKQPTADFTKGTIEACKWLELQGVRAITTNCGFYATYQRVVQDNINVPFYSSSLMQLPMMLQATPRNKKIGVLTANGPLLLKGPAIRNSGLRKKHMNRIVIEGCENGREFRHNLLGLSGKLDPYKLEQDILDGAKRLMKREPNIGSILLECTELAPSAKAVQELVRVPVWDFTTMTDWMFTGAVRSRFTGYI